jgi:hypothetical protein
MLRVLTALQLIDTGRLIRDRPVKSAINDLLYFYPCQVLSRKQRVGNTCRILWLKIYLRPSSPRFGYA